MSLDHVYDLFTFESGMFFSVGGGNSFFELAGIGLGASYGFIWGWKNYVHHPTLDNYAGLATSFTLGGSLAGTFNGTISYTSNAQHTGQTFYAEPRFQLQNVAVGGGVSQSISLPLAAAVATSKAILLAPTWTGTTFRTGADGLPTLDDAYRYADYIRLTVRDTTLASLMQTVVMYNGLLWENYHAAVW